MAAVTHVASPPYSSLSISQNSTDSTMNGAHLSQPTPTCVEAAQMATSTPTATSPASRGHQHIMPLNMTSFGPTNGNHHQMATPRGLADAPGHMAHQMYPSNHKPQIYTAVYSGISVYEMEINELVVMRRRHDSWLNATQILKIAGVEKGKRTKVLEREILAGPHNKVQGGYGKYQGTWINYQRGVEFCRQYGVEEILRPLLEYDMGQDGLTVAGHGNVETPTKEQAMAAQRKRKMLHGGIENRPPTNASNGTFFENISKTAVNAVTAIHKARLDSPGPRPASGNRRPMSAQRPSQSLIGSQESTYHGSSQHSMPAMDLENSFGQISQLDPVLRGSSGPYFSNVQDYGQNSDIQEPPRKRMKPLSSQGASVHTVDRGYEASIGTIPPTGPSQTLARQHQDSLKHNVDLNLSGLPPLPQPTTDAGLTKQRKLMSLFLDPSQTDFSNHEALMQLSNEDLDIPIDEAAHTALHWAATLARTSLLRALIQKGANIFRLNGGGETALIRAALTTNNLDQGSFPELLELLGPTIEIRDGRGRTVLHHIAVASAVKGRSSACRYYLESLLEFVVRQGSASSSQQTSFNSYEYAGTPSKSIGLVRFMSEMVNVADVAGDTALNLVARIGNKSIIHQLLEVGADPTISNRGGLKPVDFGVGVDSETTEVQQQEQALRVDGDSLSKVQESSQELLNSLTTLLAESSSSFKSEVDSKQSLIDQKHAKLREISSLLVNERRRLTILQQQAADREKRIQRVANLRAANQEQRARLSRITNGTGGTEVDPRSGIKIGEADAGLAIDPQLVSLSAEPHPAREFSPTLRNYLATLPPTAVLEARSAAYERNNATLQFQNKALATRSSELESKLRRVLALALHSEEESLDQMIEKLLRAMGSEGGRNKLEFVRVRKFLRREKTRA